MRGFHSPPQAGEGRGGGFDKFRIKIWGAATGNVIYDNQLDASDTADPTTAIAGGDIVIHWTIALYIR